MTELPICKICSSKKLTFFAHTASCLDCGVLLCYPYPEVREKKFLKKRNELTGVEREKAQADYLNWHLNSGERNHRNFTNMALFALSNADRHKHLSVLDYGGGGGQFALVLKSLFPKTDIYIVDMDNERLLDEFMPLNKQIKFEDFNANKLKFDVIFMNDVFEHVSDPMGVLAILRSKLNNGGRIFIDTPCHFWLYPFTKVFSKRIHTKLLNGTVDYDHQQIWSKKAFEVAIKKADMRVQSFFQLSEYTQGADFYLDNMKIDYGVVRFIGKIFFWLAPLIAKNKIMAVVTPNL
jgi:2-polyprenyl-3-methyl-5-hydroxy-6-metoxy-1,4-benzoquinol methylase